MHARSSSKRLARPRVRRRGYTIVEIMMALAVLAIGAMGVVALQKFAVLGSLNARGIASASTVADSWIDLAQDEAVAWNSNVNTDIADMPIVSAALANTTGKRWINIPAIAGETDPFVGGGTPLYGDVGTPGAPLYFFCSQMRATWLGAPDSATATASTNNALPSDVIRIEVRTWYAKSGRALGDKTKGECVNWTATDVDNMLASPTGTAPDPWGGPPRSRFEYGFVFVSGTIRRNTL
jgi:prepilin-type N-terminal cleavage/methylation domain-containing protein